MPECPSTKFPVSWRRRGRAKALLHHASSLRSSTAARSGEALGRGLERDRCGKGKVWIIPPETHEKPGREHRVPLSESALFVLAQMQGLREDEWVFPGERQGKPSSDVLGDGHAAHGCTACYRAWLPLMLPRGWAGNRTNFPRELAEHALSHLIGQKVELAYRRDDALERRRPLMQARGRDPRSNFYSEV